MVMNEKDQEYFKKSLKELNAKGYKIVSPLIELWKEQLQKNEEGHIKANAFNIILILNNDENLKGKFTYNKLALKPEIVGDVPWKRTNESNILTDHDDSCLRNYFSIEYGIKGKDLIYDCLNQVIAENQFHPVREYLKSVDGKWDGVERVATLLIDYFDADDTELNRVQTLYTLVGAVMRAFNPGCKFDTVLTLKGPQGLGKTFFFQLLTSRKEWFTDSLEDIGNKDAKEGLIGKWIIELGEMAAVGKADQKRAKQFITAQFDTVRLPYERRSKDIPRQCIFVATTNEDNPLKDDTGNRRWWMVDVNTNWTKKNKPLEVAQIWAEALHVYKQMVAEQGTKELNLSLSDHLMIEAEQIQADNTDMGTNAPIIREVLERGWYWKYRDGEKVKEHFDRTCAMHIWEEILGNYRNQFTTAEGRNINAVLKSMDGWEQVGTSKSKFGDYGKQRVYQKIQQRNQ